MFSPSPVSFSPIPLPNPAAFEDKLLVKKQKRLLDCPSTPLPKCPSTPKRSPYAVEKQFHTELKRNRCSSDHFNYISELGSGSYGIVYKALCNKDQRLYAVKKSKKPIWNMHHRAQYLSEIAHARSLSPHPAIATIHDAWEEGGHIYTQMELCASSLKDVLSSSVEPNMAEKVVWCYISDIIQGVHHMHSNRLVHLDIKPDNILVGFDSALKLTDFGISTIIGSKGVSEGDKVYMAPELLDDQFSPAADIFSVGITLYEVVTGYDLPGEGLWWRNLREGSVEFPNDADISDELQLLIRGIQILFNYTQIHYDPSKK